MNARLHIFAAVLLAMASAAVAQQIQHVQGSQNAMTVIGANTAAAPATQPAVSQPEADPTAAFHPAGMQSPKSGALRVKFSQGTKDGPAIGRDPVTVEIFSGGKVIHTYKAQIGDDKQLELHDLPLDVPFQPIITVLHAGAQEELIGPPMHKFQPAVELDMPLYEVTAEKPAWTSGIHHVTVLPTMTNDVLALHVTDMMGGFNPTDRAWLGTNNVTLTLELPKNATNIQLGQGLAEANPTITGTTITRGKPMLPGPTEYDCGYTLPVTAGKASLTFTLPADTTLFALYLPSDIHVDTCVGLTPSSSSGKAGLEGRQLLVGKHLNAGQVITLDLSGITPPPAPPKATPAQPADEQTHLNLPRPTTPPPPAHEANK
ncbi:MAG TPA: hypothetical protein VM008_14325 [Phycisphaerae bacterium]|nr:hypothetical protein [Phycisphaerae bacterium]